MNKLLLLHPATRSRSIGLGDTESLGMPPINLGYIAALTPGNWDITIVDEYLAPFTVHASYDLVGITATTSNIMRAYELCGEFKKRKVKVVMGGVHTSMVPDEVLGHADSVVVGEAESVWPKLIKDFEKGKLKKKYIGDKIPLDNLPIPRRDLYSERYIMDVMQTTRGCPFECEYCCISKVYGKQYRVRPVKDVLDEFQTLKKRMVYFIDDNFFGFGKKGAERVIELCKGIVSRKINKFWATQASLNIAEYPEALKWAYRSGCRGVYVGIESIYPETLKQLNKTVNYKLKTEGMIKAIKTIHKYGISVAGAFIFGNDRDDNTIFQPTLEFMKKCGLDVIQIGILTPYPGLKIFERMKDDRRLVYDNYPSDWDRYDTEHINFKPLNISVIDLIRGYDYIAHEIFTKREVRFQALKTFLRTRSIVATLLTYGMNKDSIDLYDFKKRFRAAAWNKDHAAK
ncbi:MAG: B12-binding domain-containing radical SAM protein [Spirochaetales bacterium]|nr:B12-binding domain-containing radical SAM protein [Spirochaetales bacterium]